MKEMYQMSGQRFAFSKQRHLFPESPWFPKIEAELNSTLSTKEASADIAFIWVSLQRERNWDLFSFSISSHLLFQPKTRWMGKQVPGHLTSPYSLTRDTESWQGKPEPCRTTLETWPHHLAYLLQT